MCFDFVLSPVSAAPTTKQRGRKDTKKGKEDSKDVFQSAGIDLQEESNSLLPVPHVSSKRSATKNNPENHFVSKSIVKAMMNQMKKDKKISFQDQSEIEELLCIAIEQRMMKVLRKLAETGDFFFFKLLQALPYVCY